MSTNPYAVNSPQIEGMYQTPFKGGLPTHPMEPLHAITGWLTFLGWMFIVIGALYCLTIIGVIIGWLPLWTGILLKGAADKLKQGFQTGNEADLHAASKNLSTYFVIVGVITLIGLVINVLYFGFIATMIMIGIVAAAAG